MDNSGDWRVIDAGDEAAAPRDKAAATTEDKAPRWLVAAGTAAVVVGVAIVIWAAMPTGGAAVDGGSRTGAVAPHGVVDIAPSGSARPSTVAAGGSIVVDIEGAVADPGLHQLSADARVGDAIAVAGGYAATADIEAAGRTLNLAAKLTDGQQVRVPALGDAAISPTAPPIGGGGTSDPGLGGRLVDINHATAEELDTLPGIGPVTAAKIIEARTETPFATVDELQSRGVVGPSTFEKLRDLITAAP